MFISHLGQSCAMRELGFPTFQRIPSQIRMCLLPDAVVSPPRRSRISSQTQSYLLPDAVVSRPRRSRISSQTRSCLLPDAVVSPPRRSRISSQTRSCLLPDAVVSRPVFDIKYGGLKRSCYCWFLFTAFKNDLGNGVSKRKRFVSNGVIEI